MTLPESLRALETCRFLGGHRRGTCCGSALCQVRSVDPFLSGFLRISAGDTVTCQLDTVPHSQMLGLSNEADGRPGLDHLLLTRAKCLQCDRAVLRAVCVFTHESIPTGSNEVGSVILCILRVKALKPRRGLSFVQITQQMIGTGSLGPRVFVLTATTHRGEGGI